LYFINPYEENRRFRYGSLLLNPGYLSHVLIRIYPAMRNWAFKAEIIRASAFSVMSLLRMLLEKLAGLHSAHIDKHPVYTNFIAVPAITVYVFALLDKKKRN